MARETLLNVHVLDGAEVLPGLELACLPLVAMAVSEFNLVVVAQYDRATNEVVFYQQSEWLPAGKVEG